MIQGASSTRSTGGCPSAGIKRRPVAVVSEVARSLAYFFQVQREIAEKIIQPPPNVAVPVCCLVCYVRRTSGQQEVNT